MQKLEFKILTAPPDLKELEEEIEKINKEKEDAIRVQDFEKAANLRDKEKELKEEFEEIKEKLENSKFN